MANAKISALPAVSTPASTDQFAVNQGGTTKRQTRAQIHTLESGETLSTTAGTTTLGSTTATKLGLGASSSEIFAISDGAPIIEVTSTNDASGLRINVVGTATVVHRFQYGGTTILQLDPDKSLKHTGRLLATAITTLADEDTPTVVAGNLFKTGGSTTITDFDDGVVGQTIKILAAHTITITDNAAILLAGGNFGMTDTDTLTLTMFNNQIWVEIARSVN